MSFFFYFHFWPISVSQAGKTKEQKRKAREREHRRLQARLPSSRHPAKHGFTSSLGLPTSFSLFRCNTSGQEPSLQAQPAVLHPGDLALPGSWGQGRLCSPTVSRSRWFHEVPQRGEDTHWSHRAGGRPESSRRPPSRLGRSPTHPGPCRERGRDAVERDHLGKTGGRPSACGVLWGPHLQSWVNLLHSLDLSCHKY